MSENLWTPEIIATIVHRVVMVFVSLAFIWKEYRQQQPQFDEEQLISILIQRQTLSPAIGMTSARQVDDQVDVRQPPRLRDHFRANSNNIFASALGFDNTSQNAVPLQNLNPLPVPHSRTASNNPLELRQMNVTSASPLQSTSLPASDGQTAPLSPLGEVTLAPTLTSRPV
ncbi:hypothetical protein ONS95_008502 [Cadophora gregata]|uniref:uncharacterized protein n=1 Tax=Cadophora gregata TaxID=51156 RepID=UPI0026DDAEF0|nr:uncharacterized protein ONS95_008502 [Cadophora gregata]KAK0100163.1 hypothetical protein ONS95_008502 [Cadophora gregata]KAK0114891.1 hypothetical protein ONS96_013369 [Cadophora gregata f. sp. sojae]